MAEDFSVEPGADLVAQGQGFFVRIKGEIVIALELSMAIYVVVAGDQAKWDVRIVHPEAVEKCNGQVEYPVVGQEVDSTGGACHGIRASGP